MPPLSGVVVGVVAVGGSVVVVVGAVVVAYQVLSGRLPYEAQSITELALKQQREAPPLLDQLNPD
ncbi:MAG: hypothetical protein ACKOK7_07050, partial [Solirubrobacterales bacterium]